MQKRSTPKRAVRRKQPGEPRVTRNEAIWLDGKVPSGFWDHFSNRRMYLRWLGQRLGFRKREDYYKLLTEDLKQNRGGAVLMYWWNSSAIAAVRECFPDHDWKEWLFHSCSRMFWHEPENHRGYMQWLARQLRIRKPEDWYRVTNKDFTRHKGGAFLLWYKSSLSSAIMHYLPDYDWKEWLFQKTPKGFWKKLENRVRYMKWLGEQIGITHWEQWYNVTRRDFIKHAGTQFLKVYDGSPPAAIQHCFPNHDWHEWIFARVPAGFWRKRANRKRYMDWLGKRLGFHRPQDWLNVDKQTFYQNYGSGLIVSLPSYYTLLRECVPKVDWDKRRARSRTSKTDKAFKSRRAGG